MWPVCMPLARCSGRTTGQGRADIDLLVEFQPLDASSLYKAYFALLNDLRQGLTSRVDLVMADAVRNPYIRQSIDASKRQIYAAA